MYISEMDFRTAESTPAPLRHLKVLDLSRVLAGPWAGQALADLGAEVIKVERPGAGDDTRAWGPPWLRDGDGAETGESSYFASANRGKRSITLDVSRPEGQAVARRLAQRADVLLENFKVGDLARHGLGYGDLSALNPGLVYCSITGFGQTGPSRHRAGYDFLIQGMGGLMSLTGEPDGAPGGGPMKVGVAIVDVFTGLYATTAVLAALAERQRTGRGAWVDLSLLDVQVATLANQGQAYLATGRPPPRLGNAHPSIVPYQAFAARDGHLVLAVGNDGQFARFCEVAGRPELARDPRYATNTARVANRGTLVPQLAALFAARDRDDWIGALEGTGVPCGPINDLRQVFEEPQVVHRGMRLTLEHATAGRQPLVASPFRFDGAPCSSTRPPPTLGQHTVEVLTGVLGMGHAEVDRLRDLGII